MANQKLENQLNLALETQESLREASENLSAGFDARSGTWELIVKYSGDLTRLAGDAIQVEELINGYAIVTIPQNLIAPFSSLEEVIFIEKPKKLFPQIQEGLRSACFFPLLYADRLSSAGSTSAGAQAQGEESVGILSGRGVYVAVIDSGIDYSLEVFRAGDGATKIAWLWDQSKPPETERGETSPDGFAVGTEYSREAINAALLTGERVTDDVTGHGTAVAAIAAQGAPESQLIIVKLDTANQTSYPLTTSLMRAFTYVIRKAEAENAPVAINLSYGNTYGPHDGTSLLERFIDNIAESGQNTICIGTGNEGASAGHFAGNIAQIRQIAFAVGNYEQSFSLQLWKNYADNFAVELISPGGARYQIGAAVGANEAASTGFGEEVVLEQTRLLIFQGKPQPYRVKEEIYIDFLPLSLYINTGIWSLELTPLKIVNGQFQLYMPSETIRSSATRFLQPSPEATLTIPSTAQRVLSVGAYNAYYNAYADFSGRGYAMNASNISEGLNKPDLVAPGVSITVPDRFGSQSVNGTSYAAPFVTAAAALLMEWGIVQGRDPFLYGEKVKAYLQRGAKQLRGETESPNPMTGWGALCVSDSLPI